MIRIVMKRVGEPPVTKEINGSLESFRELLDQGWLEGAFWDLSPSGQAVTAYVDEEGILKGLPFHLRAPSGHLLYGTAVFSAVDQDGEEMGLTEETAAWLMETLA